MATERSSVAEGAALLQRYLAWAHRRAEGVSDAEIREVLGPDAPAALIRGFLRDRTDLRDCHVVTPAREEVPGRVVAEAVGTDGTRFRAVVIIRPDGNAYVTVSKALPAGFTVRDAEAADGPALAALCRSTPIVTGAIRTTIDYGEDYLRATALVDERIVLVVEHEGRLVGLHGCAIHDASLGEVSKKLAYLRHTRIDPVVQGVGAFSALNGRLFERMFASGATAYSLVALGNDRMLEQLPEELRRWPWQYTRFHLDTRALADPATPLVEIAPPDAAALISSTHRGEVIQPEVSAQTLDHRLECVHHMYGPDRLLGTAGAVLGVARETTRVTVDSPDAHEQRSEAVAYDVGIKDLTTFEAVLRSWCHRLAGEDIDVLAVDACTSSPLHRLLSGLTQSARSYALQLSTPPPIGATGFWVDAAHI